MEYKIIEIFGIKKADNKLLINIVRVKISLLLI
jgi:hypothetical protein